MKYLMIVFLVHLIQGNIIEDGKCPEVEPVKNFDANKIIGMWYMIQHYPNDYDSHYKCLRNNFTLANNGDILVRYTSMKKINNEIVEGNATLTNVGDPSVGNFIATSTKTALKAKFNLIIMDTDYENYLTFWTCLVKSDLSARSAWIFCRSPTPNQEVLDKAIAPLKENDINPGYMEVVDHENCNY